MPAEDSWGGPAASEPPFVDALRELGVDVVTATYVYGEEQGPASLAGRVLRVVKTAFRIRRKLRAARFDLIHLNTAFDRKTILRDAATLLIIGKKRPPVFLKIHGAGAHLIDPRSFVYRRLIRYIDRRVSGYGVFTEDELQSFRGHGLAETKFHIVRNVVELGRPLAEMPERRVQSPDERFELVFVSRFIETKGLIETIRAFALVRQNNDKVFLTCVGDGPLRRAAADLSASLGLGEAIAFTGYVSESDVAAHLLSSDIFVFPTRHTEGFPIALFKAAIAGLPIVTTPVRAAAEYLREGENCLFCNTDPDNIASKIERLIGDKELRERMSGENRKFAEQLTPERIAREYFEIYESIVNESSDPSS